MKLETLAQAVLNHALDHYEDGGWDVLVECWTIDEIVRHWQSDFIDFDTAIPTNEAEAIKSFEVFVSIWDDRQADARNSAF